MYYWLLWYSSLRLPWWKVFDLFGKDFKDKNEGLNSFLREMQFSVKFYLNFLIFKIYFSCWGFIDVLFSFRQSNFYTLSKSTFVSLDFFETTLFSLKT